VSDERVQPMCGSFAPNLKKLFLGRGVEQFWVQGYRQYLPFFVVERQVMLGG
jgi:hypothetical protein